MNRATRTLLLALLVIVGIGLTAYFCAVHLSAREMAGNDDLAWLKQEFHLTDADMQRVRELHNGYLPKCHEMCARIAAKRGEVEAALATGGSAQGQVEQKLVELGTLRAQCQAQMLRHFEDVSRAMPAEQGKRYLEKMQELTLGFHDHLENTMEPKHDAGHGHGDR